MLARVSIAARRTDGRGRHLARRQRAPALRRRSGRVRRNARRGDRRRLGAARPRRRRERDRPRLRPAGLHPHVPAHDEAKALAQAAPAPGPVRRRGAASGARPARLRRGLHRTAARLCGADDYYARASAKPQLAGSASPRWCSTRATTRSCRRGRCQARPRSARTSRSGSHATAAMSASRAAAGRGICAPCPKASPAGSPAPLRASAARRIAPWTRSSPPRSRSGPTCRIATPGSRSTRAATGTCATTASRRPDRSRASRAAASNTRSCASSSPATTPATTSGAWFFQNGPQRVYVELEAAPWVWRLQPDPTAAVIVTSHTGLPAEPSEAFLDESGRLFLASDLGLGIVHTLDMEVAADAVERGAWRPAETTFAALVERFGLSPQPGGDATHA